MGWSLPRDAAVLNCVCGGIKKPFFNTFEPAGPREFFDIIGIKSKAYLPCFFKSESRYHRSSIGALFLVGDDVGMSRWESLDEHIES